MNERGADNAPGPARRRRSSLAERALGGRGAGDMAGGRARRRGAADKRVCLVSPPALLGAGEELGVRGSRTVGPHALTVACSAQEPPGARDACQLGGA